MFTACTTDNADNPSVDPTLPTITPEPTTDQLEVKVTADMPMAVLSEFSENSMGAALMKRVSRTTTSIEDDTKFILFKGDDILTITNEQWMKMAHIYLNGGYVGIERATNREMLAFAIGFGFAIGMAQDEILEENGVEVGSHTSSNEARGVTNELQRRIGNARTLTRAGGETAMNDALSCSDEFVISHSLGAYAPDGKIVTREDMGTTTIKSWSVHDFGSNQDFYYVDEKVVIRMGGKNSDYNKTFYWGPYSSSKWNNNYFIIDGDPYTHYYGSWLNQILHSLDLKGNGEINVEASLPATDNSTLSSSVTVGTSDGTSETSGWNIGLSAGYQTASFSLGYSSSTTTSHTNSFSKTMGETNKSLKVTRNTSGTKVTFDYQQGVPLDWNWDPFIHDMAPDILTNDCEVNNMVCWRVKNPSEGYQLNISTKHKTECMAAYYINKLVPKDGYFYYYSINWNNSYDLKQPCRYMGTWNCEIITKGENRKQNASKYFREFLQESVAEAPFKVRFNVAERSQGETDVMKNLVTYVSSLIKEGTRKRRTIDNEARDLGIESFTITWYSDDPDVTTEYTISGKIKEE